MKMDYFISRLARGMIYKNNKNIFKYSSLVRAVSYFIFVLLWMNYTWFVYKKRKQYDKYKINKYKIYFM